MEIGEAVGRYEQAAALLPSRWQQAVLIEKKGKPQ